MTSLRRAALCLLLAVPLAAAGLVGAVAPAAADTGCATAEVPTQVGGVYQLSTPGHLQWLKDADLGGTDGQLAYSYLMTGDIDLAGCTWTTVIGDGNGDGNCTGGAGCFSGVFNGGGFTVRNLSISSTSSASYQWIGFIGDVVGGTVRDLNVAGTITVTNSGGTSSTVTAGMAVGFMIGSGSSVSNVTTSGSLLVSSSGGMNLGGVVGSVQGGTVSGLTTDVIVNGANLDSSSSASTVFAGGVVGSLSTSLTLSDSSARGSVSGTGSNLRVGGAVGSGGTLVDVSATGAVSGSSSNEQFVGGLLGFLNAGSVTDSSATGTVTTSGAAAVASGGLIGFTSTGSGGTTVTRSWANGDVTSSGAVSGYTGGLIGHSASTLSVSYAKGDVTFTTSASSFGNGIGVGGLAGYADSGATSVFAWGNVSVTTNTGDVKAGGIAGYPGGSLTRSYSLGSVSVVNTSGTSTIGGSGGSAVTAPGTFCLASGSVPCTTAGSDSGTPTTLTEMQTIELFTDAGWSITDGYSTSTTWGICARANSGYPFLTALFTRNPCVEPDPSQVPPSWHKSIARADANAQCPAGWSPSWATWPNGRTGGFVCNLEIYWDVRIDGWAQRSLLVV